MECPYNLLGVLRDASPRTIEKAWRQKARQVHPDKVADEHKAAAEESFKKLSEAHELLADPERRQLYDIGIQEPKAPRKKGQEEAFDVFEFFNSFGFSMGDERISRKKARQEKKAERQSQKMKEGKITRKDVCAQKHEEARTDVSLNSPRTAEKKDETATAPAVEPQVPTDTTQPEKVSAQARTDVVPDSPSTAQTPGAENKAAFLNKEKLAEWWVEIRPLQAKK